MSVTLRSPFTVAGGNMTIARSRLCSQCAISCRCRSETIFRKVTMPKLPPEKSTDNPISIEL